MILRSLAWLCAVLSSAYLALAPSAPRAEAPTVAPAAAAQTPPPGVALWRLSDADSVIWLLGSVHLLEPNTKWRRPAIDAAIKSAERAYFETRIDLGAQIQAGVLTARLGTQPPGAKLSDQLSPKGAADLAKAAAELGVDRAQFERLRPWFAMLQLATLSFKKQGLEPHAGVENELIPEFLRAKREIRYLETVEQQLRFLADLPAPTQIAALESSLAQLDEGAEQLDQLLAAWRSGDVDGLERVNARSFEQSPELHEVLITRRNRAWVKVLMRELEGSGEAIVVVGAAHLVGDGGVPALLAAEAAPLGAELERR